MKIEIKLGEQAEVFNEQPEEVIKSFLNLSSEILTKDIKKETPVDYGKLRGSWTPKLSKDKLTVTNSRNYAVFVEKGTGIFATGGRHRIFPKHARVMHYNRNGQDYFFYHSKGQPGKHMAEKGFMNFRGRIPKLFQQAIINNTKGG